MTTRPNSRLFRIARLFRTAVLTLALAVLTTPATQAWTDFSLWSVAEQSASIAPPDLMRILAKHEAEYRRGVLTRYNARTHENVRAHLVREVDRAVEMIRSHRPFDEVSRQLGVVAHFVSLANEPIDAKAHWADDYRRYIETAQPRFAVVFYGFDRDLNDSVALDRYLRESLARRVRSIEVVESEYDRIHKPSGIGVFDDRSPAFGIAASAFSRSLSDIAVVLRYIWIEAGGTDSRASLPLKKH